MYINLGVAKGISLLGGLSVMGIVSQIDFRYTSSTNSARLGYGCYTSMGRNFARDQNLLSLNVSHIGLRWN